MDLEDQLVADWIRVDTLISRIDVSKFPMLLDLNVEMGSAGGNELLLVIKSLLKDSTNGSDVTISFIKEIFVAASSLDHEILSQIRFIINEFVRHELNECFLVDDERYFKDEFHHGGKV